jgi:hypothetical protein
MVEATEEDALAAGEQDGMRSRRFPFDNSLLTALVDRWRPETHTFHFRWGEMTVTLQDVACLLGLPLAGNAIGPSDPPSSGTWTWRPVSSTYCQRVWTRRTCDGQLETVTVLDCSG